MENQTNKPIYKEELERLQLEQTEQELYKVIEDDLVPSPSILQKYNQMIPNGAERILTIIEEEKKHQRNMERNKNRVRNITKISSLVFGFVLTLIMFKSTMNSGVTRLEFILLWAITLIVLGIILAPFIKENLSSRRDSWEY